MERRDFIIKSGTMLTAAVFFSTFGKADNLLLPNANDNKGNEKRPNPEDFKQPILKAIAIGINAPSPHNTQSWKFKIVSDTELLFFVDEKKLLPATDPPSRQIHIGAGCFIETLVIGATSIGYKAVVNYFPQGYVNGSDFGKKPVASITLIKTTEAKSELADFILKRQTNRRVFNGDLINDNEFAILQNATNAPTSKLKFINSESEIKLYADLLYKGFEVETLTYKTSEETRKMFRFSEEERAQKGDGLSIPQMGYKGLIIKLAESSLRSGDEKTWHSDKSNNSVLKNFRKGIDSSKGFIFLISNENQFIDWVKSGQDFVRLSLAATKMGLYLHPCNQVIQEYDEMKTLRNEMDKMTNIVDSQKIQMIARIGRSSKPYMSYRQNVKNYLID